MSHSGLKTGCQTSFVTRVCLCVRDDTSAQTGCERHASRYKNANCGESGHKDGGFSEPLRRQHCKIAFQSPLSETQSWINIGGGRCGNRTWSLWWCCHSSLGPSEAQRGYLRQFSPAGGSLPPLRPANATQPPSTLEEHTERGGDAQENPELQEKMKRQTFTYNKFCGADWKDLMEEFKWAWCETSLPTKVNFLEYFYQEWRIVVWGEVIVCAAMDTWHQHTVAFGMCVSVCVWWFL